MIDLRQDFRVTNGMDSGNLGPCKAFWDLARHSGTLQGISEPGKGFMRPRSLYTLHFLDVLITITFLLWAAPCILCSVEKSSSI